MEAVHLNSSGARNLPGSTEQGNDAGGDQGEFAILLALFSGVCRQVSESAQAAKAGAGQPRSGRTAGCEERPSWDLPVAKGEPGGDQAALMAEAAALLGLLAVVEGPALQEHIIQGQAQSSENRSFNASGKERSLVRLWTVAKGLPWSASPSGPIAGPLVPGQAKGGKATADQEATAEGGVTSSGSPERILTRSVASPAGSHLPPEVNTVRELAVLEPAIGRGLEPDQALRQEEQSHHARRDPEALLWSSQNLAVQSSPPRPGAAKTAGSAAGRENARVMGTDRRLVPLGHSPASGVGGQAPSSVEDGPLPPSHWAGPVVNMPENSMKVGRAQPESGRVQAGPTDQGTPGGQPKDGVLQSTALRQKVSFVRHEQVSVSAGPAMPARPGRQLAPLGGGEKSTEQVFLRSDDAGGTPGAKSPWQVVASRDPTASEGTVAGTFGVRAPQVAAAGQAVTANTRFVQGDSHRGSTLGEKSAGIAQVTTLLGHDLAMSEGRPLSRAADPMTNPVHSLKRAEEASAPKAKPPESTWQAVDRGFVSREAATFGPIERASDKPSGSAGTEVSTDGRSEQSEVHIVGVQGATPFEATSVRENSLRKPRPGELSWPKAVNRIQRTALVLRPVDDAADLKLRVEGLGEVRVSLQADEGVISARFVLASEAARELVEGTLPELRENLIQRGLLPGRFETLTGYESSPDMAEQWQQPKQHSAGRFEAAGRPGRAIEWSDGQELDPPEAAIHLRVLDIRV